MKSTSRRAFLRIATGAISAGLIAPSAVFASISNSASQTNDLVNYGDGTRDATAAIQNAINRASPGEITKIPPGTYLINADTGITLRQGSNLELSNGTIILSKPSKNNKYALIKVHGIDNVKISGGALIGERLNHLGKGGEWGMGISIRGSTDVDISNMEVSNCWGDGIYIGSFQRNGVQVPCANITIRKVVSKGNRRQGLSITSCNHAQILDSKFLNTAGTAPASGIDLEPNPDQPVTDILIKNCDINDNAGSGIIFSRKSMNSQIVDCRLLRNRQHGIRMSGATRIEAIQNQIENNHGYDIMIDKASKQYKLTSNTTTPKAAPSILNLKFKERVLIEKN